MGTAGHLALQANVDKCLTLKGDVPECTGKAVKRTPKAVELPALGASDKLDWHYIQGVLTIYDEAAREPRRAQARFANTQPGQRFISGLWISSGSSTVSGQR